MLLSLLLRRASSGGLFYGCESDRTHPRKIATKYWSANVFGNVAIIEEGPEKQKGIEAILRKYSPEHVEKGLKYIEGAIHKIYVLRLEIREATGKARKK